jgi:hypothetical protein
MTRAQRRRSSGLACREHHPKPNGESGLDPNPSGIRAKLSDARVGSQPVKLEGVEGKGYRPKPYGTGPRRAHLLGHRHVRPAAPYLPRARRRRRRPRRAPLAPTSGLLSSEPSKGCAPRSLCRVSSRVDSQRPDGSTCCARSCPRVASHLKSALNQRADF